MSKPIPPSPESGFSPSLYEFAVIALVSLAVTWAVFVYVGPLVAAYPPPVVGPMTLLQP